VSQNINRKKKKIKRRPLTKLIVISGNQLSKSHDDCEENQIV
jgi:hypothetical protein